MEGAAVLAGPWSLWGRTELSAFGMGAGGFGTTVPSVELAHEWHVGQHHFFRVGPSSQSKVWDRTAFAVLLANSMQVTLPQDGGGT